MSHKSAYCPNKAYHSDNHRSYQTWSPINETRLEVRVRDIFDKQTKILFEFAYTRSILACDLVTKSKSSHTLDVHHVQQPTVRRSVYERQCCAGY